MKRGRPRDHWWLASWPTLPSLRAPTAATMQRMGTPRTPADLLQHRLIGYDRDDTNFLAEAIPRELAV